MEYIRKKNGETDLPMFVVQEHQASHLHYDMRLELDGILKSWVVPKGPTLDPDEKRLAVMVDDHPVEYGSFEGIIPEGNYGAGTVMVWDIGSYAAPGARREETLARFRRGLADGRFEFVVFGKKLRGLFTLVRLGAKRERTWMLIKERDAFASDFTIEEHGWSALTYRTMAEVRNGARVSRRRQKQMPLSPIRYTWGYDVR